MGAHSVMRCGVLRAHELFQLLRVQILKISYIKHLYSHVHIDWSCVCVHLHYTCAYFRLQCIQGILSTCIYIQWHIIELGNAAMFVNSTLVKHDVVTI